MRESASEGEAIYVEEFLVERLKEEAREDAKGRAGRRRGREDRGIVRGIARVLAYNGVITRGMLGELSRGSSAGRQMISFLKKCGLLYETRGGYILSVPWLVYFYRSLGEGWVERVKRLAPYIRGDELRGLGELVREASQGPLGRFVEAYISSMEELRELVAIPARLVPGDCEQDWGRCFSELLDYSKWLLTVLAGLLELYARGAGYGEAIEWLDGMARHFHETLVDYEEEGGQLLSYFDRLVTETAVALKRHAVRLYETYRGRSTNMLEEALEWAVERYRRAGGRYEGRARYYAGILLRETAKAVLADISTGIALLP
jgi:hypothetical protein